MFVIAWAVLFAWVTCFLEFCRCWLRGFLLLLWFVLRMLLVALVVYLIGLWLDWFVTFVCWGVCELVCFLFGAGGWIGTCGFGLFGV